MGILFYPFSLHLSVMSEWRAHILWKHEKTNSQKHWTCLNTNCINSHVCNTGSGEPLVYKWWNRYRQTINKDLHRFTATQKDHKPPKKMEQDYLSIIFQCLFIITHTNQTHCEICEDIFFAMSKLSNVNFRLFQE